MPATEEAISGSTDENLIDSGPLDMARLDTGYVAEESAISTGGTASESAISAK